MSGADGSSLQQRRLGEGLQEETPDGGGLVRLTGSLQGDETREHQVIAFLQLRRSGVGQLECLFLIPCGTGGLGQHGTKPDGPFALVSRLLSSDCFCQQGQHGETPLSECGIIIIFPVGRVGLRRVEHIINSRLRDAGMFCHHVQHLRVVALRIPDHSRKHLLQHVGCGLAALRMIRVLKLRDVVLQRLGGLVAPEQCADPAMGVRDVAALGVALDVVIEGGDGIAHFLRLLFLAALGV